jgi:hypothetical protein
MASLNYSTPSQAILPASDTTCLLIADERNWSLARIWQFLPWDPPTSTSFNTE